MPTSGIVEINGRVDTLFNINLGFRRDVTGQSQIFVDADSFFANRNRDD